MIVIDCPYCGERHEPELKFGGEAFIARPDPATVSDEDWADYLFMRKNPKGHAWERWCCVGGCGQWFIVERDTVSHAVLAVHRYGSVSAPKDGSA